MIKFIANLNSLFIENSFLDRFSLAKKAGFNTVEFKFPEPLDVDAVEQRLKETELRPYLFNFPIDVQSAGGRGVANNPEKKGEFCKGVKQAQDAACRLGVKNINFFCGNRLPSYAEEEMWNTLVSNLQYAADELIKNDINITFQPLNHHDNPDIFIESIAKGLRLHKAVGRSNVFIQLDIYHVVQEGEDVFEILNNDLSAISHIQIADYPGRHQPGTGKVDFCKLLKIIEASPYSGFVSLEYIPVPDTLSSFEWFHVNGYNFT